MIKKMSLKLRITLLTGLIITLIAILLTALGIFNSNQLFVKPTLQMSIIASDNANLLPATTVTNDAIPYDLHSENLSASISALDARAIITTAQTGFSRQSILIMVLIIVLGLATTYFAVGRALAPLTSLSGTIANITEHNLCEQAQTSASAGEIASLTNSFNEMLARLQQSFDLQKRFSASAAHELKTPLSTIKTSLQVLSLDESPSLSDFSDNSAVVSQSVDRLIEIVNNLLLFSNSDVEMRERINLLQIIEQCHADLQDKILQKNLDVQFNLCDCEICGNRALMRSAIYNLLENAVKYNRQDGAIFVSSEQSDAIHIKISDTGIGIPSDALPHVSEPFYRADESRSKEIPGNGLGLSIVKSIIENHQGKIQITSQYNLGTTAQITFDKQ